MLSILPAVASLVGFLVLAQVPTVLEMCGIALVVAGVGIHRPAPE